MKKIILLLLLISTTFINAQTPANPISLMASPNPFAQRTLISYTLMSADTISLDVYSLTGNLILTLKNNFAASAGAYNDSLIMNAFPDNLYLLKLTSKHGNNGVAKVIKTSTTGIAEIKIPAVKIYPNPTSATLTIENLPERAALSLVNVLGETVYTTQVASANIIVDLSKCAAGIYYLKINNGKGLQIVKIVKE
jgi:hypothetical protein